jgi:hypothetical protein
MPQSLLVLSFLLYPNFVGRYGICLLLDLLLIRPWIGLLLGDAVNVAAAEQDLAGWDVDNSAVW